MSRGDTASRGRRRVGEAGSSRATASPSRMATDQTRADSDLLRAVGYVRRSKTRRDRTGQPLPDQWGIAAQRNAIERRAEDKGWNLVDIKEDDGRSGATLARPGFLAALEQMSSGQADVLVAAKLDRLSRSTMDFLRLVERAMAEGWSLVVLDQDLDMTKPLGRACATILAALAQYEREMISIRTKEGLEARAAEGKHNGRKSTVPQDITHRIHDERLAGASFGAIATALDSDGIPTPGSSQQWSHRAVRDIYRRVAGGVVETFYEQAAKSHADHEKWEADRRTRRRAA
jgi:DNA invertase Pin-like site-specific DNA recombinase